MLNSSKLFQDLSINPSSDLYFYVNNKKKCLKGDSKLNPTTTVLEYLRENGFCGTKLGCNEGGCGACTVVIAEYDFKKKMIKYLSANACLLPLCSVHNKQIITVEGLGNPENPHCIQDRLAKGHGSQCGFCTPGIVMSMYCLLKLDPNPSFTDIEEAFDGNLCRCTGYRPILESFRSLGRNKCSNNENDNQCKSNQNLCDSNKLSKLVDFSSFKPYDPNQDLPFPLDLTKLEIKNPLLITCENSFWFQPSNLSELLHAKNNFPNAKLVGGNTEIGIEIRFKSMDYKAFINVSHIEELKNVNLIKTNGKEFLEIGVNITLTDLIEELKDLKKNNPNCKTHHYSLINAFLSNLKWFASRQIRNFATLAGNISTGSPISDLNPILVANDAILIVASEKSGERQIEMRKFFLSYRKIDLQPEEIILKVLVPMPENNFEQVRAYKQAKRKDDDIAIVNGAFRVKLEKCDNYNKISSLDLSYGGLAPTTVYLSNINHKTKGLIWGKKEDLELIQDLILNEVNLAYSVPGGMPTYRRALAVSFFVRFWYQVIKDLNIKYEDLDFENLTFNIDEIEREISSGVQDFGIIKSHNDSIGTVDPHLSALKQTTGEALYLDDIPKQNGELYAGLVLSTRAHAYIKNIDPSRALSLDGVHDFVCYKDVPKHNKFGIIIKDEEFFASKEVLFYGQLIGLIIAEERNLAKKAASLVQIEYEDLDHILTIEDAIKHNSFFDFNREIKKGIIDSNTFKVEDKNEDLVFEGTCRIGGQEHFYLETNGCLVIPKGEDNELEVFSSTQNLNDTQFEISSALGIPQNKITCRVKRVGGGFGGKETRTIILAVAVAVAAKKLKKPIRYIMDRDIDMVTTGKRHPVLVHYKLRISRDGIFKAYELDLISNAGHSFDLSRSFIDRTIAHADNVYLFPIFHVRGRLAKTNIASNTAFRGFGGPQGMMVTEMMISEVTEQMNMDPCEIRQKNLYKPFDITHVQMKLEDYYLPELWNRIIDETNYAQQRIEIEEFNNKNKWKKRGIAITPTKFGLAFGARFLNQAGALVHIYTDGSVLISHGGIEIGQGLHTKMVQIAASTLNISIDKIYISETSTDKIPNASPTAASVSSDINGMAVEMACKELNETLEPYRKKYPDGNFEDWVSKAYFDRVSLSAKSFYKTPDIDYDWQTNTGNLYSYFTTGVAISSVELDLLTGDHTILRSDIYMDVGNSINYAIDIGQIEGAFMQGVGWCTLEKHLVLSSNGSVFTKGPGTYKIPSFRDVPTIKSSKGVGEPPLFLGASVFFALRDAVTYARKSNQIKEPLKGFESPCTSELLRLACNDEIIKKANVLPRLIDDSNSNEKQYEKLWAIRP